jgi:MFS family permease
MTRVLPRTRVLWIVMVLLGLTLVAAGFAIGSIAGIVVCIIVGGLFLGVINTVLTECVMAATDLPRTVASSAYSGVRFLGGAIAPPLTTWLAAQYAPSTPYFVGGAAVIIAAAIIIAGSRKLAHVNLEEETPEQEAEVLALADAD